MATKGISSPAEMIQAAISGGASLEKLEKFIELQERWEANQAKKLFTDAFSAAQAGIIAVTKTEDNSQTHSKYASLDNIIISAKPVYTKEGLSVVFYEGETTKPEHIRVCADVLHSAGHKETYYYDVPLDGKGIKGNANMTNIHAKSSSVSYGRRYLMCMIWNIPTQDDDDGNAAGKKIEYIDDKQKSTILDLLTVIGGDDMAKTEAAFIKFMKIEKLEFLPQSEYQNALVVLGNKKRVMEAKKAGKK